MKRGILIVAPYLPWPADFGGAIRIYEFIKHLSRDQHVMLLAPAACGEMAAIQQLRHICDVTAVPVNWTFRQPAGIRKRATQAHSLVSHSSFVELASQDPRFQAVMDRLFMTRHIDLVQFEFPQMVRFELLRPCPTVVDNHNIEHELLTRVARSTPSLAQRVFNNVEWRKVRRLERDAWQTATLNIATSDRDARRIETATGCDVPVVPNGVNVGAYDGLQTASRRPGRVVFVGAMRHHPNADGAQWYAEEIHPLVVEAVHGATFEIVGADPPPAIAALAGGSITVTGSVESIVAHLAQASVAVVPLRSGGGTRLKVLEAFAAGIPVVSTSVGSEGIDAEPDKHMLIADTAREFANAVIRILRGAALPASYSTENASRLVRSQYDWEQAIGPALVTAHDVVIERFEQARGTS